MRGVVALAAAAAASGGGGSGGSSGEGADPGWFVAQRRDPAAVLRAADAFRSATAAFNEGRLEDAVQGFTRCTEAAPEITDAWANAGVALEALGRYSAAAELYRRGLAHGAVSRPGRLSHYLCNMLLGHYERDGDLAAREEAPAHCGDAVRQNPGDAQALFNLAAVHAQRLQYADAIANFRAALKLRPKDAQGLQNLANVLLRAGDPRRALAIVHGLLQGGHNVSEVNRLAATALSTAEARSQASLRHMRLGQQQYFAAVPRGRGRRDCALAVVEDAPGALATAEPGGSPELARASSRLLWSGGEEYGSSGPPRTAPGVGPPPAAALLQFRDKSAHTVTYHWHYLAGASGCVYGNCTVHTGDHGPASRCADELTTELLGRGPPGRVRTVRAPHRAAASAMQQKTGNHYHWLCEGLSRVVALSESVLRGDPDAVLLVPRASEVVDASLELLGAAVVPPERVERWDPAPHTRYLYPLLHTVHFRQDDRSDPHLTEDPWYFYFPPARALRRVRELLRAGLRPSLPPPRPGAEVVWISRRDAGARTVPQEDAVVALLRGLLGDGVTVFAAQGMKLRQQLAIFYRAQVVVGPHGAGFANCIVCQPGTHVVLLPMRPYADNVWAHLCSALGLELWMVPELHAFYYTHYNATAPRRRELARTLQAVLQEVAADGNWAAEALARPQWTAATAASEEEECAAGD